MKTLLKSIYGRKPEAAQLELPEQKDLGRASEHGPIFFAHIPKTAGTSFKKAAIDYYGESRVVKNYGPKSIETSQLTRDTLLQNTNLARFKKEMERIGVSCYMGHVHFLSTRHAFDCTNLVTFVRNPVEQVVSHYNHYKRWHGYEDSIETFVAAPAFKNVQHKFMSGIPLYLVGLVGITERYNDSLSLYNCMFDTHLAPRSDNVNEKREISEISDALKVLIMKHNALDMDLYSRAVEFFEQRYRLMKAGQDWVYGAVHWLDRDRGVLSGLAFRAFSDEAVEVELVISGKKVATCLSNHFRPGFAQWNIPNCNHIGFQFQVPENTNLDELVVRVKNTGQILMNTF